MKNKKVKLHLYKDMNIEEEIDYWGKVIGLSRIHFRKPYIKSTTLKGLTYKTRGHGIATLLLGV